jgi:hypothetical protein
VSVEVTVALAGGVTELGLNEQVGPLGSAGATAQARVTAEAKPLVDVTVIVAVADPPGCPEVGESASSVTVKFVAVPDCEYFATKASKLPPPKDACAAPVVTGKLPVVDPVFPVT